MRVLPPSTPKSIAPGMHATFHVRFAPDSLADCDDFAVMQTEKQSYPLHLCTLRPRWQRIRLPPSELLAMGTAAYEAVTEALPVVAAETVVACDMHASIGVADVAAMHRARHAASRLDARES